MRLSEMQVFCPFMESQVTFCLRIIHKKTLHSGMSEKNKTPKLNCQQIKALRQTQEQVCKSDCRVPPQEIAALCFINTLYQLAFLTLSRSTNPSLCPDVTWLSPFRLKSLLVYYQWLSCYWVSWVGFASPSEDLMWALPVLMTFAPTDFIYVLI